MEYEMNRYYDLLDDMHEMQLEQELYEEECYWIETLGYNPGF